ncbi:MAG: NINE protein [Pseudanabaenaceae cyanobacterium]|jgi:TM2 domain-containing membrane protein YozV
MSNTPVTKSRTTAALWCFFLGGFGAHKFYLNQNNVGLVYLLCTLFLFWTIISPIIIGLVCLVEFIQLLIMSDNEFNEKYNSAADNQLWSRSKPQEITDTLRDLKNLYDDGIITPEEYEEKRQKLLKNL